ncbi:S-layer homology domain-containing protein [Paenibacillus sinopodophylli]|uniref:S-layer homology domain-containing protein n=1 Tax=Paenibacillus sinopodophylli TaxID=1837342 RepID=UPI001BB23B23|nr:S-layer homology domain-containing protein [Paenibacillus sinopodophylli]
MKKKIAAFALASALVLPLSVPAFAATPTDVVGKPVQSAVEELSALGILAGYEDGTFKPENAITRAELAKIVVIATGNESAATLMNNVKPTFKDVKTNVWYTGYINVAAAKGFIQGFNGNYRPSDSVAFEEVVAILVRALGYQDKYLSGSWPYNVILQADNLELFNGVEIATGTKANRGVVAELASNTLGATLVGYDADGNQLDVDTKGKKIATNANVVPLINKLGTTEDKILTGIALNSNKEVSLNNANEATAANFFVTGGKSLGSLLGHSVSVLKKNGSNQILAITDAQAAGNIISATSDVSTVSSAVYYNDGSVKTSAAGIVTYENTDKQATNYALANDRDITILLNGAGNVQALLVNVWDSNKVLDEVVAYKDYSRVTTKNGSTFKVVSSSTITLDGKAATLADLKSLDVLNVIVNDAGEAVTVAAVRSTVSGKLESVGKNGTDTTYNVGGKSYVAVDAGLGLAAANIGTEYTYYLNKDGKVAYYATANAVDNSQYALIQDVQTNVDIIKDGQVLYGYTKVVYYSLKDSKAATVYTKDVHTTVALKNTLVELKFDADGVIDLPATTGAVSLTADEAVTAVTATKLTTAPTANTTTNYVLNSNTIYLKASVNATDSTKSTITVATAADAVKGSKVAVKAEAGVAKYVVVTTDGVATDLAAVHGLYISTAKSSTSATSSTYSVTLNVNGENKTFAVSNDATLGFAYDQLNALAKYSLVTLSDKANSNNSVYEEVTAVAPTAVSATLTVNNDTKTIVAGGTTYVVTADTQIFLAKKALDSVSTGSFTDLRVAADGTNYGPATGQYQVVVQASGTTYGGIAEAGVIIVVTN